MFVIREKNPLVIMHTCPTCGTMMPEDVKYLHKCKKTNLNKIQ